MAERAEEWEGTFEGITYYGACGARDVLIVSSSECSQDPNSAPRQNGELTQEDMGRLASEGIPQEDWQDDVKLMEARYHRDSAHYTAVKVEKDPKSPEYLLGKIETIFNNTANPGVLIHYIGPGKLTTGDWCCKDGFISFQKLMKCYTDNFSGKTLEIICDCSYSGRWIQFIEEHLDTCKIQPCGHCAKSANTQLFIAASCKADEIPHKLCFSARGCGNDKNNGAFFTRREKIAADQRCDYRCNMELICGVAIDTPCQLRADYTWENMYQARKLMLIEIESESGPQWVLLASVNDEDTRDQIRSQQITDVEEIECGEVIRKGRGKEPSARIKKWINKEYPGHTCF